MLTLFVIFKLANWAISFIDATNAMSSIFLDHHIETLTSFVDQIAGAIHRQSAHLSHSFSRCLENRKGNIFVAEHLDKHEVVLNCKSLEKLTN